MILKTIPVTFTFTLENTRRKKKEITHDKADGAWGFPGGSVVKNLPAKAGDSGSILGLGRSPGVGNDNSLQYSCLENSMGRGAWRAPIHGVTKSQTQHD